MNKILLAFGVFSTLTLVLTGNVLAVTVEDCVSLGGNRGVCVEEVKQAQLLETLRSKNERLRKNINRLEGNIAEGRLGPVDAANRTRFESRVREAEIKAGGKVEEVIATAKATLTKSEALEARLVNKTEEPAPTSQVESNNDAVTASVSAPPVPVARPDDLPVVADQSLSGGEGDEVLIGTTGEDNLSASGSSVTQPQAVSPQQACLDAGRSATDCASESTVVPSAAASSPLPGTTPPPGPAATGGAKSAGVLKVDGLYGAATQAAAKEHPELAKKFGIGTDLACTGGGGTTNCGARNEKVAQFQAAVNAKNAEEAEEEEDKSEELKNLLRYVKPSNVSFDLETVNSGKEKNLVIDSTNSSNNILYRAIRLIATLVGTLAILLYIVGAYFLIFSQGDENQLTKGKQIVLYTSLGLILSFGAYIIVQLVMGLIYFAA